MESKKYTVAIDLGESNVVVVVGSKDQNGLIAIDNVVSHPCEGVKGGMIENIALVEASIKTAVEECERVVGIRVTEAYAGISGEFVRFACHSDHVYVADPHNGVSQSDVDALFDRMKRVQAPDNEVIMERLPQNYMVDDTKEVKNPVGSFGRRLSSTFNFILCATTPIQRLENALRRLGIKLIKIYPNTLAVADSVLSPDEKEEGVAVVNIGGGLTDLVIYYRNVVRYTISIPMGASAINKDIRTMMIPEKSIEKLKREHGSAVADMVSESIVIQVNGRTPREAKQFLLYNMVVAIEERMSMLIDFIKHEIKESGYEDKLPYGIVITGGSAKLKNLDELFRRMTDLEIRIGEPIESIAEQSIDLISSPEYATAVGILIRGVQSNKGGIIGGIVESTPVASISKPTPKKVYVQEEVTPDVPTPRIIGTSEVYTPPKREPYTPPKSVVQPQESAIIDEESIDEESGYEDSYDDESAVGATTGQQEESDVVLTPKPKSGRDWGKMFKIAGKWINDGFDTADDEEI